jgi:hypothetical protein
MDGYLYFIIRGEDAQAPIDQSIYVKIGRTGNPARRISNYNAAYIGDRPPVYYRLLKVENQVAEEVNALSVFEKNRVRKGGSEILSEVVLITKEAVDGYQPLCRSPIAIDPVSLPRLEETYAAEPRVIEHTPKKRRGRPPKQTTSPMSAMGTQESVETESGSGGSVQLSERAIAEKIHVEMTKKAYYAFCRTNTSILLNALRRFRTRTPGNKIWISDAQDANLIAEHLRFTGQALLFTNEWAEDKISKGIQDAINQGNRPDLVILVLDRREGGMIPHTEKLWDVCDCIVSGALQPPSCDQRDICIATYHPNLLIFSTGGPPLLQDSDWNVLLPRLPTGTNTILASPTTVNYLIDQLCPQLPEPPQILPIQEVAKALVSHGSMRVNPI